MTIEKLPDKVLLDYYNINKSRNMGAGIITWIRVRKELKNRHLIK